MNYKQLDQTYDSERYNSVAQHPLQSWEWGEARIKTGLEIVRIGGFENETLKEVFLMTIHPLPKTSYKLGYIPRSILPSAGLIEWLKEYAQKHNLIFVKFEPDVNKNSQLLTLNSQLRLSPHPLFPDWTQEINLDKSEAELLAQMKQKTRYNTRLAEKKGVHVEEMSSDGGFKLFSLLYFDTTERQKYFGHTPRYHQIVWDTMKKNIAHILVALYEDKPLAAYELFLFKDKLYYPYGGSSPDNKAVMAPNLLMWEAIKFGKKHKAKSFDLWGSLPANYDPNDSWAGFTRFKEGYGAEFVQKIGSYDLVINPTLYQLYNLAHKLRALYLKLIK
ncbi:MAG: lipid II:glycine glycyltransferase FemX [Weeksellaceae bacterium]